MSVKQGTRTVKPILSLSKADAHTRVLGLYRAFYRSIPYILQKFDIEKNSYQCKMKIREYFYRNRLVTDVRIIDTLILKGYMELNEILSMFQQKHHIAAHWKPTYNPKPKDFLGKFIESNDD